MAWRNMSMAKVRVAFKRLLSRVRLIPSFCKDCGRTVHDFHAPDVIWRQIAPGNDGAGVLCYDCFCERCAKHGLPSVYTLHHIPVEPAFYLDLDYQKADLETILDEMMMSHQHMVEGVYVELDWYLPDFAPEQENAQR